MGEALFELERILRSRRQDNLTLKESYFLQTCKSKAVKQFSVGAFLGAGIAWTASWRLNNFIRLNLSGGAAALSGLWMFGRTLDSCVDHILAMDGSRMQKELANIIATKYQSDPRTMQHMSKNFYSEKVFDDSTSDEPKVRWRYRNFFSDNVSHGQRTHGDESYSNSHGNSHHMSSQSDSQNTNDSGHDSMTDSESKQVLMMPGIDTADPVDCIFGPLAAREEIKHQNASDMSPKPRSRSHRRSRRQRQMHQQPVLLNP